MSTAIKTMMNEHRTIERVLDALDDYVASMEADPPGLARFVEFFVGYADRLHHAKEEDVLFEAMVAAGFPRDGGPIAVMLFEHEEGRALVRTLHDESVKAVWTDACRQVVRRAAGDFGQLLRQHIAKEDQILYPMAQAKLSPDALAAVDRQCAQADEADEHRERLEALAVELTTPRAA